MAQLKALATAALTVSQTAVTMAIPISAILTGAIPAPATWQVPAEVAGLQTPCPT